MTLAILFSDVGAGEWLLLLVVILIVMGPKRLPETARKFGHYYSKFRRAADSFKRQLMEMDTEINNAVADAGREAEKAFSVEEGGTPPDGAESSVGDYDPESPYPGYGGERNDADDSDDPGYATDEPADAGASVADVTPPETPSIADGTGAAAVKPSPAPAKEA